MSDPDTDHDLDLELRALFASDAPPAHDADFVVAVARRAARRKLMGELVWGALTTAISALILWALGPVLLPALRPIGATALMFAPLVVFAATVLFLVHPRSGVA
jgi:hypothetical protein